MLLVVVMDMLSQKSKFVGNWYILLCNESVNFVIQNVIRYNNFKTVCSVQTHSFNIQVDHPKHYLM